MQKKLYTEKETKVSVLLIILLVTFGFFYIETSRKVIAVPSYITALLLVAYIISFAILVTYYSSHYQNQKLWVKFIVVTGITLFFVYPLLGYRDLFDFLSSLNG